MVIFDKFKESNDVTIFSDIYTSDFSMLPDGCVQLVSTYPPAPSGDILSYKFAQMSIISEAERVLSPKGSLCWWIPVYDSVIDGELIPLDAILYPIFKGFDLKLRNRIAWTGNGFIIDSDNHGSFDFSYGYILWFTKSDDYVFNLDAVRVPQKYPNKKHYKGSKKGQLSGNPLGKNPSDFWKFDPGRRN